MEKRVTKTYDNGEVTIVWQPHKCIHSAICFRGLPTVFNPQNRPWVTVDGADTDSITHQIDRCPSGALSYRMDTKAPMDKRQPQSEPEPNTATLVEVSFNGPLMVHGRLTVKDATGNEVEKSQVTAFCRCGQSYNKPYCDGSHARTGFVG
jgi:uncharacterized Fe-S cluster protein YjdI